VGRQARLLVVGDSVGYWLGDSMAKQSSTLGLNVGNRARFGCPLTRDSIHQRDDKSEITNNADCQKWPTFWIDDINRFRPDVVLMVFGGPPPLQRDIPGGWAGPCDASFIQWYTKNVNDAIDVLSSKGAMVFVAPEAYPRFPFEDWKTLDPLVDCMTRVYDSVVASKPLARVVPIDRFVCPSRESCIEDKDGVHLRDDGIHYTGAGADYMARWLAGQMLRS
jgi:hypothetical protein